MDHHSSATYLDHLAHYLQREAPTNVEVTVAGMSPPARGWSRLSELRGAVFMVQSALAAQDAGYDAFVLGHFQEPGLYETRSTVQIPVIGMGEATLLWSTHLGRRFGLVSIDSVFEAMHFEQVDALGLGDRLIGVRSLKATLQEFESAFSSPGYEVLRERFLLCAKELIDLGSDVIVPAGGLFGMASAHEFDFNIDGIPIVPSIRVTLEWANMSMRLTQGTGVHPSRRSSFRLANPEAIHDFQKMLK